MSETKFTPGPYNKKLEIENNLTGSWFDIYAGDRLIASTHQISPEEEDTANATLLETAPEMYEVLAKISDIFERKGWCVELQDAIVEAPGLLAKARGEV